MGFLSDRPGSAMSEMSIDIDLGSRPGSKLEFIGDEISGKVGPIIEDLKATKQAEIINENAMTKSKVGKEKELKNEMCMYEKTKPTQNENVQNDKNIGELSQTKVEPSLPKQLVQKTIENEINDKKLKYQNMEETKLKIHSNKSNQSKGSIKKNKTTA